MQGTVIGTRFHELKVAQKQQLKCKGERQRNSFKYSLSHLYLTFINEDEHQISLHDGRKTLFTQ